MKLKNLLIVLFLSEARNVELQKRVNNFERLLTIFSNEIDRQRKEIDSMKQKREFNLFRRAA
jgi:hypothetical protein